MYISNVEITSIVFKEGCRKKSKIAKGSNKVVDKCDKPLYSTVLEG